MSTTDAENSAGSAPSSTAWSMGGILAIVSAVAIAGLCSFRQIYENDVGWHLALGRVFSTRGIVFENALAWTTGHYRWYPTSWLYDWLSWQSYSRLGPAGVQELTLVLMLLVIAGLVIASRGARTGAALLVLPATMVLLIPRLSPRPHVATWAVVAWTLAFARLGRDRDWRWRLAALPVIALGSNLHQGAGLATGVLGLFCIEAAWREKRWVREGSIAVGSILALMAIPGVSANIQSIRDHLKLDDVLQLIEYRPPTLTGPAAQPVFFLLAALLVPIAWVLRRDEPANIAAAAAVALMAFTHGQRWIFEYFILLAPLLVAVVARLSSLPRALSIGALVAAALASSHREADHFLLGMRWDPSANPIRAVAFMEEEEISGRFFNGYHDGGYLSLAFPNDGVYMDSRPLAYPPGFFTKEMTLETNQEFFLRQMRANKIEIGITGNYGLTLTGMGLFRDPDWALVYRDEVTEVYLRRDVPRFAEQIGRLEIR